MDIKQGLKDLRRSMGNSMKNSNEWFFWFCVLWTISFLVMNYVEFFSVNYKIDGMMTVVYIGFITTYAANKEVNKWTVNTVTINKPGELFIFLWGITLLIMVLVQFFSKNKFQVPEQLPNIMGGVLAVFIGSQTSRSVREKIKGATPNKKEES